MCRHHQTHLLWFFDSLLINAFLCPYFCLVWECGSLCYNSMDIIILCRLTYVFIKISTNLCFLFFVLGVSESAMCPGPALPPYQWQAAVVARLGPEAGPGLVQPLSCHCYTQHSRQTATFTDTRLSKQINSLQWAQVTLGVTLSPQWCCITGGGQCCTLMAQKVKSWSECDYKQYITMCSKLSQWSQTIQFMYTCYLL